MIRPFALLCAGTAILLASPALAQDRPMQGMDHSAHAMPMSGDAKASADPFYAPGSGLAPVAADGGKFLSYADLKAQKPLYEHREATREIELRLTGNMERYVWTINGKKYEDEEEIRLTYGERVRFRFVNETMMTHPMHLHGMWSDLEDDQGRLRVRRHTIPVQPAQRISFLTTPHDLGRWAWHCHLLFHMDAGMFREVVVS